MNADMSSLWQASLVVLWVLLIIMAFLLAGALRQIGLLRLRIGDDPGALITDDGLPRGSFAPDFEAVEVVSGDTTRLSERVNSKRAVVFLSTGCLACRQLAPHLKEVVKTRSDAEFLVVISGDMDSCRQLAFGAGLAGALPVWVDQGGSIAALYQVAMTPFTYVTDEDGRVLARGVANDWRGLDSLLDEEGTLQAGKTWETVPDDADEPAGPSPATTSGQ